MKFNEGDLVETDDNLNVVVQMCSASPESNIHLSKMGCVISETTCKLAYVYTLVLAADDPDREAKLPGILFKYPNSLEVINKAKILWEQILRP